MAAVPLVKIVLLGVVVLLEKILLVKVVIPPVEEKYPPPSSIPEFCVKVLWSNVSEPLSENISAPPIFRESEFLDKVLLLKVTVLARKKPPPCVVPLFPE